MISMHRTLTSRPAPLRDSHYPLWAPPPPPATPRVQLVRLEGHLLSPSLLGLPSDLSPCPTLPAEPPL